MLDVDIEYLDAAGDGIARAAGRRITVPFTLPGERVRISVGAAAHAADLAAVLRPSPHRVTPGCRHFGPRAVADEDAPSGDLRPRRRAADAPADRACGGCTWQHIAYPEQLRLKAALVTRLVRRAVPSAPEALPTIPGAPLESPWGYRHKVHFVFGGGARRDGRGSHALAIGHYARGSRRPLPVCECPVHVERGNRIAFRMRDAFAAARIGAVPDGPLKSIVVRASRGTDELAATLVVTADGDPRLRTATRRLLETTGELTSFDLNVHPRNDAFVFGAETRHIRGPGRVREDVAGIAFLISPTAFFQTNVRAAESLVRLVLDATPAGARVLDLYAGAGLFALPLARAGHDVVAVEEHRAAVADGLASLRLNRLPGTRCRFIARGVEQALASPAVRGHFDVVVLDPPRDGCSRAALDGVFGQVAPATAVYVSCNPEALARDLARAAAHGYRIESIQPVDMFPHTAHVETVVVLARNS